MIPTPAGRTLGRWRLEAKLGEGATSTVWAATDTARHLSVALKVLKSDEVDEQLAQRRQMRMMRESEALIRSAHPNVVRIVEIGRVGTRLYLAMERIDGVDLRVWLESRRTWPEIVSVFLQCAQGLAAAHRAGIVHRDFKPANVMVSNTGRAVVTDFGLARGESPEMEGGALAVKLTAGGVAVGTPRYMAPEQHQAGPADARTDQFALGVALFEALYGQHPYAPNPRQDVSPSVAYALATLGGKIVAPPEPDPPLPKGLAEVVRKAIELTPEGRYRDLDELIAALDAVVLREVQGRKRTMYAALAGGVALAALATVVTVGVLSSGPEICRARPGPLDGRVWIERLAGADAPAGSAARAQAALEAWSTWWRGALDATCAAARAPQAEARLACLAGERSAIEGLMSSGVSAPPLATMAAMSAALESRCGVVDPAPTTTTMTGDVADAVALVSRDARPLTWLHLQRTLSAAATQDLDSSVVQVADDALVPDPLARAQRREAIGLVLLGFDRRKPALAHLARALDDATAAGAREQAARIHGALTEAELAGAASDAALGELAGAEARVTSTLERLTRAEAGATLLARALEARAWIRGARGDHAAALADAREAVSRARDALGEAHPLSVSALYALGTLEAQAGTVEAALPKLEEAARRRTGPRRAEVLLTLSRVIAPRNPARAKELARDARNVAGIDRALASAIEEWMGRLPP